jgi:hypothetical protein
MFMIVLVMIITRQIADDFEKNLKLAQRAYLIDPKSRSSLRSLLEAERSTGMHAQTAPRLHCHSGACALLWMRRNLEFHASLFRHMYQSQAAVEAAKAASAAAAGAAINKSTTRGGIDADAATLGKAEVAATAAEGGGGSNLSSGYSPSRAALIAYGETTSRYHGWALQQVRPSV